MLCPHSLARARHSMIRNLEENQWSSRWIMLGRRSVVAALFVSLILLFGLSSVGARVGGVSEAAKPADDALAKVLQDVRCKLHLKTWDIPFWNEWKQGQIKGSLEIHLDEQFAKFEPISYKTQVVRIHNEVLGCFLWDTSNRPLQVSGINYFVKVESDFFRFPSSKVSFQTLDWNWE